MSPETKSLSFLSCLRHAVNDKEGLDRLSKGLPQELVDVAGEEAFEALALALHVMKTIIDTSGIDDSGVLSTLNLALDLSRNILLSFEIKDSGELQEVSLAFHAFRDALISEHIDDDGDKVRKADDSNKQPSRPSKRPRTDDSGVMGMDDSIETASRPSKRLRTKKPDKRQAYAFTYNIKQPIMHSEYQQIMTNFEDNVGGFISTGNMYPDDSGSSRENGLSSTLRSCFRSNSCTSELDKVTKLKACFIMLTLYDLAMLYKPTDTGSLRPTMFHDIKEQIKRMGFNEDLELGKVAKWALMGKGINALCKEFGDGCLLYLANHMPLDLTQLEVINTHARRQAFRYLHSIGLKETAEREGANEFARKVRHDLIEACKTYVNGKSSSHNDQSTKRING